MTGPTLDRRAVAAGFEARYGLRVADGHRLSAAELELVAGEAGRALAEARAIDILRWAGLTFGDRLVVTSSMSDGVVAHLASRAMPGVAVAFLDTGLHFPETLGTRDALAATLDIRLIEARPALSVADQEERYGSRLWLTDPDRCCQLRKVRPLRRVLEPFVAWVTGIRGDESASRVGSAVVAWDAGQSKVKINPIVRWSQTEVDAYASRHQVPVNPLRQLGYPSIGCAPCTRPVRQDEDARAGRWPGSTKAECGIHT